MTSSVFLNGASIPITIPYRMAPAFQATGIAMRFWWCVPFLFASQDLLGESPGSARIVLVGEQPDDREDLAGR